MLSRLSHLSKLLLLILALQSSNHFAHIQNANNAVECVVEREREKNWSKNVDEQKHMVRRPQMTRENVSDVFLHEPD